jgi:hypothetical protein
MWCETHRYSIPFVGGLGYNSIMKTTEEIKKYLEERLEHYRLGMEHAYVDEQYKLMKTKWEAINEIYQEVK